MENKEFRIYVDGKLVNINYNYYACGCNVFALQKKYGIDRVSVKEVAQNYNLEEKKAYYRELEKRTKDEVKSWR